MVNVVSVVSTIPTLGKKEKVEVKQRKEAERVGEMSVKTLKFSNLAGERKQTNT